MECYFIYPPSLGLLTASTIYILREPRPQSGERADGVMIGCSHIFSHRLGGEKKEEKESKKHPLTLALMKLVVVTGAQDEHGGPHMPSKKQPHDAREKNAVLAAGHIH